MMEAIDVKSSGPAIHYECEEVHLPDAAGSCLRQTGELPKMWHDPGTDYTKAV